MMPLIDVVFLLLTFFVLSLVYMVRADVLGIQLPAVPGSGPGSTTESITVSLDRVGNISVNGVVADPLDLPDILAAAHEHLPDAAVILAADEHSSSGDFIRLQQLLSEVGFTSVVVLAAPSVGEQPPPGSP
ncbi:biopolymer transporter ExbD [Roseiflexus sp. AH-315-K22]|nr:biopolymer transporter ExbD [Roseiflexus sp. AH-315-K22]